VTTITTCNVYILNIYRPEKKEKKKKKKNHITATKGVAEVQKRDGFRVNREEEKKIRGYFIQTIIVINHRYTYQLIRREEEKEKKRE
jgi:hypothetical protein